jgi:holo-[acyl-carrier protein] synthase
VEAFDGVIGIGVDLVQVSRVRQAVERRGDRFTNRILSEVEILGRPTNVALDLWIAGRFAAKEACLKALGTGWADGLAFHQVLVRECGKLEFRGNALQLAERQGVVNSTLALTVCGDMVAAMVILDGSSSPGLVIQ